MPASDCLYAILPAPLPASDHPLWAEVLQTADGPHRARTDGAVALRWPAGTTPSQAALAVVEGGTVYTYAEWREVLALPEWQPAEPA